MSVLPSSFIQGNSKGILEHVSISQLLITIPGTEL